MKLGVRHPRKKEKKKEKKKGMCDVSFQYLENKKGQQKKKRMRLILYVRCVMRISQTE